MALPLRLAAIALASLPLAAPGEDYFGILKPPRSGLGDSAGVFSLSSTPLNGFTPARGAEPGYRLKLGYKYSRFLSVESEFVDFGRAPADVFSGPGNLASAFRSTGFGVDTVATLPVWRSFSFYGRLGASRGEMRNAFGSYSTSLLGEGSARTRWRYGLGMRYDFSKAFGIHAELERYSPLATPLATDGETELFTLGVNWRF